MNDNVMRELWMTGHKCEIYSISKGGWFEGNIDDIFMDEEGEWIEVRYHHTCTKQVQRFSANIRPHPEDYDEDKSMMLVNGYIRTISKIISINLHLIVFAFYFEGYAPILKDGKIQTNNHIDPLFLILKSRNKSILRLAKKIATKNATKNRYEWTRKHDEIICTMSKLLFEITKMFKIGRIQNLCRQLRTQLIILEQNMDMKKKLIVFGYIRSVQTLLIHQIIPIGVKELCLLYYYEACFEQLDAYNNNCTIDPENHATTDTPASFIIEQSITECSDESEEEESIGDPVRRLSEEDESDISSDIEMQMKKVIYEVIDGIVCNVEMQKKVNKIKFAIDQTESAQIIFEKHFDKIEDGNKMKDSLDKEFNNITNTLNDRKQPLYKQVKLLYHTQK